MMSKQEQIGQVLLIIVGMTMNLVLLVSVVLLMCIHSLGVYQPNEFVIFHL